MAIEFQYASITPSTVDVGQGFVLAVQVTYVAEAVIRLLDATGAVLHDKDGLRLLAKQEVSI